MPKYLSQEIKDILKKILEYKAKIKVLKNQITDLKKPKSNNAELYKHREIDMILKFD